ncbi:MAG: hypothetical protein WCR30_03765 [Clostridia bacterium]
MFKKILLAVLAVLVIGSSSVAFSWWDRLTLAENENNIITMGEGLEIVVDEVVINPTTAGNLIPVSAVKKQGDTYSVVLSYTIRFEATLEEELNLSTTVSDIKVNNEANPYDLIKVEIVNPGTIQNEDVVVTLTVTIDETDILTQSEEAQERAYEALANNSISFKVTFSATRQG